MTSNPKYFDVFDPRNQRVLLVYGPDETCRNTMFTALLEALQVFGTPVEKFDSNDDPQHVMERLALLRPGAVAALDNPQWLRRTSTGMHPVSAEFARMLRSTRPVAVAANVPNPGVLALGEVGSALQHHADVVVTCANGVARVRNLGVRPATQQDPVFHRPSLLAFG